MNDLINILVVILMINVLIILCMQMLFASRHLLALLYRICLMSATIMLLIVKYILFNLWNLSVLYMNLKVTHYSFDIDWFWAIETRQWNEENLVLLGVFKIFMHVVIDNFVYNCIYCSIDVNIVLLNIPCISIYVLLLFLAWIQETDI